MIAKHKNPPILLDALPPVNKLIIANNTTNHQATMIALSLPVFVLVGTIFMRCSLFRNGLLVGVGVSAVLFIVG